MSPRLFVVLQGDVQVFSDSSLEQSGPLKILKEGAVLGYSSAAQGRCEPLTVKTGSLPAVLLSIPIPLLSRQISENVQQEMLRKLERQENRIFKDNFYITRSESRKLRIFRLMKQVTSHGMWSSDDSVVLLVQANSRGDTFFDRGEM